MNPYKVLFVCWGNICRSPAAENVFRKLIEDKGLTARISCDSAGTISAHAGHAPDDRMQEAGLRRGIPFRGQSRMIRNSDYEEFDLILAMDKSNMADLQAMRPRGEHRAELRMFGSFVDADHPPEVPDPYYRGSRGFEKVLDMVEQGCGNLIDHILRP